jgi:hypothetical protein
MDAKKPVGPMFRKLAIHRLSTVATSDGKGFAGAIDMLTNGLDKGMKAAFEWADQQIQSVRYARDADPSWTDEDIAKMIMDQVEKRLQEMKANR